MLTRDGFDMIKVLKNYSAKSERRELSHLPNIYILGKDGVQEFCRSNPISGSFVRQRSCVIITHNIKRREDIICH